MSSHAEIPLILRKELRKETQMKILSSRIWKIDSASHFQSPFERNKELNQLNIEDVA